MRRPILLTALFLLLAGFVFSQEEMKGSYDDLARTVEKKIRKEKKTDIEELKVTNDSGTIYLGGVAKLYGSKWLAGDIASDVDGVKSVKNEIALTSTHKDDVDIEGQIIAGIRSNLTGSPFDLINVQVHSGFVVLTGLVRDQTLVQDAWKSSIWVPGVRGVENKIQLASISAGDERLRQIIYTRIQAEFPRYFLGKDPSILIIVNNGRVELIGYVDSNVSREKIGIVVRSIHGVLSLNNQLQVNH
jgi:osmotically-inducible protein OsmY